jgi:hypothetical protein
MMYDESKRTKPGAGACKSERSGFSMKIVRLGLLLLVGVLFVGCDKEEPRQLVALPQAPQARVLKQPAKQKTYKGKKLTPLTDDTPKSTSGKTLENQEDNRR